MFDSIITSSFYWLWRHSIHLMPHICCYMCPSCSSENMCYIPLISKPEWKHRACDLSVPLISIRKAVFFKSRVFRMNRGLHCHAKFTVHTQLKCLICSRAFIPLTISSCYLPMCYWQMQMLCLRWGQTSICPYGVLLNPLFNWGKTNLH